MFGWFKRKIDGWIDKRADEKLESFLLAQAEADAEEENTQNQAYRYGISYQFLPEKQMVDIQIISPPTDGKSPDEMEAQAHQLAEIIANINTGQFEQFVFIKLAKIAEDHPEHRPYIEMVANSIHVMKKFRKSGGAIRPSEVFQKMDNNGGHSF